MHPPHIEAAKAEVGVRWDFKLPTPSYGLSSKVTAASEAESAAETSVVSGAIIVPQVEQHYTSDIKAGISHLNSGLAHHSS